MDDDLFWRNTIVMPSGCIEWQRAKTPFGYGKLHRRSGPLAGSWIAHRYSYALKHGVPPSNLNVCHLCDNPSCVNPEHLWIGTQSENIKDCYKKGRSKLKHPKEYANWKPTKHMGEKNPAAKLKDRDIKNIRLLYFGERRSQREIGEFYGVSSVMISRITRMKNWVQA